MLTLIYYPPEFNLYFYLIFVLDKYCTPQEFSDHLFQHFPMLKDCGGFQLLRSRGSTRSKKLETIPCPDDGYSPEYLLSESVMVGQALIYIQPLQKDLQVGRKRLKSLVSNNTVVV